MFVGASLSSYVHLVSMAIESEKDVMVVRALSSPQAFCVISQVPRNDGANPVIDSRMEVRFSKLPAAASGGNQTHLFRLGHVSPLTDIVRCSHSSGHGHGYQSSVASSRLRQIQIDLVSSAS
jgi:hypothetical protein